MVMDFGVIRSDCTCQFLIFFLSVLEKSGEKWQGLLTLFVLY